MRTLILKILLTLLTASFFLITLPLIFLYKTYEDLDSDLDF